MRKKMGRISITWDDELDALLAEVAEKHGKAMEHNGIEAYTSTSPTQGRKPNTSGIIRYLLMDATKKIKRVR
jgi:hypothetical protein